MFLLNNTNAFLLISMEESSSTVRDC